MFATGIENSYPDHRRPDGKTKRVDEMEQLRPLPPLARGLPAREGTRHRVSALRPAVLPTHIGPGRYDWAFTDETFNALLRRWGSRPSPTCATSACPTGSAASRTRTGPRCSRSTPGRLRERFPWVRYYTPVNEIYVAATFSAQYGWWNERAASDRAFVTALEQSLQGQHAGDAGDPRGPAGRHLHPERVVGILPRRRARVQRPRRHSSTRSAFSRST